MSSSEKVIIDAVLAGDLKSFKKIVTTYQDKLIYYAQTIVGDYQQAQDVVQISFISVYKNLRSYNSKYKFSSWIYRIVHNNAVNSIKKNKSILSLDFADWLAELIPGKTNLEEEAQTSQTKRMVKKCLDNLPLKYKEVLVLFYLQDTPYKDISDILKIPTSTVGTRIKRGKSLLKNICLKKGIKP